MTSKNEMPEQVFLYKNGEHLEAMEFTPAPTHRDWTLYTRKDLSPPVPDDVADAVEVIKNLVYGQYLSPKQKVALETLIRAASTPSAEVHGKALDAAIETFKEERERWATEKRSLERRLKEALNQPHTGGK